MAEAAKITWYRCKIDRALMSELMERSDARGFAQVIPQLGLFAVTGTLAYFAYANVHRSNWPWALPLLLFAIFVHGTFSKFFFGIAGHELCHKTPFRTQAWNTFFLKVYSFISWFDYVGYRVSHTRHHQATVHADDDGEVVLPQGLTWHGVKFVLMLFTINPPKIANLLYGFVVSAQGRIPKRDAFFRAFWLRRLLTETNDATRREHRRWARTVLLGHLALAAVFVATGHWFLIVVFTFGCHLCDWLHWLCASPQHIGLSPNVPDFRLCTRTYTCGWLPAFLYWNMQYHLEHHMFPAVPFYNLPRLRRAIEHDLPPATHGLWATWKQLLPIMARQRADPKYVYVPPLPANEGDHVTAEAIFLHALGRPAAIDE